MTTIPFNKVAYNHLTDNNYKFLELLGPNGQWDEINDGEYRRQFVVKGWKQKPENSIHYVLDIADQEVRDMVTYPGTLVYYLAY